MRDRIIQTLSKIIDKEIKGYNFHQAKDKYNPLNLLVEDEVESHLNRLYNLRHLYYNELTKIITINTPKRNCPDVIKFTFDGSLTWVLYGIEKFYPNVISTN